MLNLLEYFDDKKIIVNSIFVRPAKPVVITEQLLFSNITYDFSKITGEYNYYPANVYVKITYGSNEEKSVYRKVISSVLSELSSQDAIKIAIEEGNYYKGVYVGSTEIEDKGEVLGTTEIEFRCEPFKVSETKYSNEIIDYIYSLDKKTQIPGKSKHWKLERPEIALEYYMYGINQYELAKKYGLSQERIKQIIHKEFEKIQILVKEKFGNDMYLHCSF